MWECHSRCVSATPHEPTSPPILVVDDEEAVRKAVRRALVFDGHAIELATSGAEALALLADGAYGAVVLDVRMPGIDGLEVCRRLRAAGDAIPILMLTANDAVSDRVAGLDVGADDYLVKPFAIEELQARVRALIRRHGRTADDESVLRFGDVVLDVSSRMVNRAGRSIELTRTEFNLLEFLLRHPRRVLSHSALYEHVWGYDFGDTSNSLGVYIGYLRRKLEAGGEARIIQTVHGSGYVLREP